MGPGLWYAPRCWDGAKPPPINQSTNPLTISRICVKAKLTLTTMVCEALLTGRTAFSYPFNSLARRRASSPNGFSLLPLFLAEREEDGELELEEEEKPPEEDLILLPVLPPALPRVAPSTTDGTVVRCRDNGKRKGRVEVSAKRVQSALQYRVR